MTVDEFNQHKENLFVKLTALRISEEGYMYVPEDTLTDLWSIIYGITGGISNKSEKEEFYAINRR